MISTLAVSHDYQTLQHTWYCCIVSRQKAAYADVITCRYCLTKYPISPVSYPTKTCSRGIAVWVYRYRGYIWVGVPTLPKCRVPVFRPYRTYQVSGTIIEFFRKLAEVSGTGTETIPNLPKCRVPVSNNTELTEVADTGAEFVPNKYPYLQDCGRGYTGTRGTGIAFVPNLTGVFGRVLRLHRTLR